MTRPKLVVSQNAVIRFAERAGVEAHDVAAEIRARAERCLQAAEAIGMGGGRFVVRTGRVRLLIDRDVVITALPPGLWWAPGGLNGGAGE